MGAPALPVYLLMAPLTRRVRTKYVGFCPHATPVVSYAEHCPGSHLAAANNITVR